MRAFRLKTLLDLQKLLGQSFAEMSPEVRRVCARQSQSTWNPGQELDEGGVLPSQMDAPPRH
ncbi:MAG TPA: hypothetical protein VMV31_09925 [Terriglobales bacterium]|nr:hypothetical protein [Terriglobales bacterium]